MHAVLLLFDLLFIVANQTYTKTKILKYCKIKYHQTNFLLFVYRYQHTGFTYTYI